MTTTRRQFLLGAGGLVAAAVVNPLLSSQSGAAVVHRPRGHSALLAPATSGVEHIVAVCMENRSFDHFLGWLPGANGRQAGLFYPDAHGALHPTFHLTTFQGCGHRDPDHSYNGARIEYDGGKCDGWLRVNDRFSIGYYQRGDLPFFGRAAPEWTVCDNYFAATLGPTFPNRLYLHAARTDRTDDGITPTSLPTIWDRLAAAGVSHAYYFNDLPFVALWGLKYASITRTYDHFKRDAARGTLPAVSYVDPPFNLGGPTDGTASDDHPHSDIRNGEAFLNSVYRAVTTGPAWDRTVLVITFDEWGGFFDHVAPSVGPDSTPSLTGLRGFRVPTLVVSPFAKRRFVASRLYDHTSILKLIEWRFGLSALSPRDAAANNLAEVLDLTSPDLRAPQWNVNSVFALPCFLRGTQTLGNTTTATTASQWTRLRHHAIRGGWHLPA
jgi:phospholipase C